MRERPSAVELEQFEEALRAGKLTELRRIWPRIKETFCASNGDWLPAAVLAHQVILDRRTLLTRVKGQPFVWNPLGENATEDRWTLIHVPRYRAWDAARQTKRGRSA